MGLSGCIVDANLTGVLGTGGAAYRYVSESLSHAWGCGRELQQYYHAWPLSTYGMHKAAINQAHHK